MVCSSLKPLISLMNLLIYRNWKCGFGPVSEQLSVGGNGLLQIITHHCHHHMSAVKSTSDFPNSQFSVEPRGAADVQDTAVNEIFFFLLD